MTPEEDLKAALERFIAAKTRAAQENQRAAYQAQHLSQSLGLVPQAEPTPHDAELLEREEAEDTPSPVEPRQPGRRAARAGVKTGPRTFGEQR